MGLVIMFLDLIIMFVDFIFFGLNCICVPACVDVVNMASYAISSSMILVIHDNMINGTNHIVENALVDIYRSHGCKKCHMPK
jgi:hypothetical protein